MTELRTERTGSSRSARGVGRMTAVMRAVSLADGPRRMRVAVVEGGKVLEERLLRAGEHFTVGSSERAALILPSTQLPPVHRLLEHTSGGYRLCLLDGMTGRVAHDNVVAELSSSPIDLPPSARGKIHIGSTTLLFQLVIAPPEQPRAQLPIAVQRRFATDVDWLTTVVAAFSFLLHFFAVALVYSDWMDPVLDDEYAVAQLVETLRPQPPPADAPLVAPQTDASADAPGKAERGNAPRATSPGRRGDASRGSSAPSTGDARAAELSDELSQLDVATLRVLQAGGPAIDDVLGDGNVPVAQLEEAARSSSRAGDPQGIAGLGRDGRSNVRPGETEGLSRIGNERATGDATREGIRQPTRGPQATANASGSSQNGSVPGADATVARMRGRFRHCYQSGLNDVDPSMAGSVTLVVRVGPGGEVLSVSGGGGGLTPIVPCLKAVVQSAQFQAPTTPGGGIVMINITFLQR